MDGREYPGLDACEVGTVSFTKKHDELAVQNRKK